MLGILDVFEVEGGMGCGMGVDVDVDVVWGLCSSEVDAEADTGGYEELMGGSVVGVDTA